jgi:hypothetical protein
VKKPRWLKWQSGEKSSVSKSENLKNVRRQTDQKLKQQDAQNQGDEPRSRPIDHEKRQ